MLHRTPFLAEPCSTSVEDARVVVLPVPYEGGVSYGTGTSRGPDAILEASSQVEFYDALLGRDSRSIGIVTAAAPDTSKWDSAEAMDTAVEDLVGQWVKRGMFTVTLGGDHSIAGACVRAHAQRCDSVGVIQFDAHADLRAHYDGSPLSHACAMARIRETTPHTLQLGIRSLCQEEATVIEREELDVFSVQALRGNPNAVRQCLESLPAKVYLSIDVDVFDGSVVWSTGTPEPGGVLWYEMTGLLEMIFSKKTVVGVDLVELAPRAGDVNSAYAMARLVYYMIGLHACSA